MVRSSIPVVELDFICITRWKIPSSILRDSNRRCISPTPCGGTGLRENEVFIQEQEVCAERITKGSLPLFSKRNTHSRSSPLRFMVPKSYSCCSNTSFAPSLTSLSLLSLACEGITIVTNKSSVSKNFISLLHLKYIGYPSTLHKRLALGKTSLACSSDSGIYQRRIVGC